MKRKLIFCFFLIALFAAIFCACAQKTTANPDLPRQCLRIHIRANSDAAPDQEVKLKVRDSLTEYLSEELYGCADKAEAYARLENSIPQICAVADRVLRQNGFEYGASVRLANESFPARAYGELNFPAGNYDALIVGLGDASGENWWCVAFPPLCFVPNGDGENVVYKSWVKEIIDKIFGSG
jgi:stage II sporulation protein R